MLFPILFNFGFVSIFEYSLFLLFIMFIILSLIYDWQMHTLN
jgi:NADH:ubiquinone oxidoreductase subunit 3 (subunit A)